MLTVAPADLPAVRPLFPPERPGPLVVEHVLRTGVGQCRVDRWPDPRAAVAVLSGGNLALGGDPAFLPAEALADERGFVVADDRWLPTLRALDAELVVWDRVMAALPADAAPPVDGRARLLGPADAEALAALDPELAWIHESWDGPAGLAASGRAYGVEVGGRVVAVAASFYVGERHEDIGVVTEAEYRGRGLAGSCAAALVGDIRARGTVPTWTTSPGNAASRAVAARLGFTQVGTGVLYGLRVPIPD